MANNSLTPKQIKDLEIALRAYHAEVQKTEDSQKALKSLTDDQRTLLESSLQSQTKATVELSTQISLLERMIKRQTELNTEKQKQSDIEKNNSLDKEKNQKKFSDTVEKDLKKMAGLHEDQAAALKQTLGLTKDLGKEVSDTTLKSAVFASTVTAAGVGAAGLGAVFGKLKTAFKGFSGKMGGFFKKGGGGRKWLAMLGLSKGGIWGNILAFDEMTKKVAKFTAQGLVYNNQIKNITNNNRILGATYEDVSDAIIALYKGTLNFTNFSKKTQNSLIRTVTLLKRFQVSMDDSTKLIKTFTSAINMSGPQADKALKDIAAAAMALKLSPAAAIAAMAKGMNDFVVYGDRAVSVFKGMLGASKALNIDVTKLNTLFGKSLDTFKGAADFAGRFNTAMSRDVVDTISLMRADLPERIRMIKKGFILAGKSIDQMNKWDRQFLANITTQGDVTAAVKLFRGSLDAYDEARDKAKAARHETELFAKRMAVTVTITEKMKALGRALAVAFLPMLQLVNKMLDGFLGSVTAANKLGSQISKATGGGVKGAAGGMLPLVTTGATALGGAWLGKKGMKWIFGKILKKGIGKMIGGAIGGLFGNVGGFFAGMAIGEVISAGISKIFSGKKTTNAGQRTIPGGSASSRQRIDTSRQNINTVNNTRSNNVTVALNVPAGANPQVAQSFRNFRDNLNSALAPT